METQQITALSRILRSVLETCCHSDSNEKPSANAKVTKSQMSKIMITILTKSLKKRLGKLKICGSYWKLSRPQHSWDQPKYEEESWRTEATRHLESSKGHLLVLVQKLISKQVIIIIYINNCSEFICLSSVDGQMIRYRATKFDIPTESRVRFWYKGDRVGSYWVGLSNNNQWQYVTASTELKFKKK